jgi:hypothetical protein
MSLYSLSESFASKVGAFFEAVFPASMKSFYKNLEKEGLPKEEGCIGQTPFTCFSITRDYTYGLYDDDSDYGYGIILWLYPDGNFEVSKSSSFWLNEYKVMLKPPQTSAMLINAARTVH